LVIDFSGQTALVTGGTRGIGAAIARELAGSGARVIATGTDAAAIAKLQGGSVRYEKIDFDDSRATEAFAQRMAAEPISVLVNNAAINILGHTGELDMDVWDRMQRVNLRAPLVLCRAIAPRMAERKYGRIVNITSVFALVSRTRRISYSAGKSGLAGMTRALALDYAANNVLVNALAPGIIDTELTRKNLDEKERAEAISKVPVGRMGTEDEIARAVLFLASNANTFITGQHIAADGGFTCV
jgi:3-oxoacyl-[acyl-carrier protein] reductase